MKLSIITINLNNAEGLRRTIESVISQSYPDYEYIVIDGDSQDGSVEVIQEFRDRITYWVSEKDKGIYNAMNKGIKMATGEYCLFLNSGDWIVENTGLSNVLSMDGSEDIVTSRWLDYIYDGITPSKGFTFYLFFKVSFVHCNTLIKRSLFDKIGYYDESFKIVSDWLFFLLAIFRYNCTVHVIDYALSQNELPGISLTQMELQKSERNQVLEKYFPYFIDDYKELQRLKQSRFVRFYQKLYSNEIIIRIYRRFRKSFRI